MIDTTRKSTKRKNTRVVYLVILPIALGACAGPQSALAPAGNDAADIAQLFWVMTAAGILIWAAVVALALYATRAREHALCDPRSTRWLIMGGGAIFPTVVLAALLSYGLAMLPEMRDPQNAQLRIKVSGEQFWWRVHYELDNGESVELANEIRIPLGKKVEFILESPDVIHSFWVPSLGGKMDMIPGRSTRLSLQASKAGTYRGACAEYCGTSHAYMNFHVVVMPPAKFNNWLEQQTAPARDPASPLARAGERYFLANGCGACHRIRGTRAAGEIGPDLTHVGSRLRLGAGMLPTGVESFRRWISDTEAIKPEVKMPSFGMLPDEQITAIAHYLNELQ